MVLHRESRFNHEAKRRDQEIAKLKERFLKLMSEAKKNSCMQMSIDIIGDLADKPDGLARGRWKNDTEDQRRTDELIQKTIDSYQVRQEQLVCEIESLKGLISDMMSDLGHPPDQAHSALELPMNIHGLRQEWQTLLDGFKTSQGGGTETNAGKSHTDQKNVADLLEEHFTLNTFIPLSEVKHSAPPKWISRAHCTLPPTGKAETVKLRTSYGSSDEKQRPRSSHLSPYRGMQATSSQNQALYKSIRNTPRSGSMSPTSASPSR